MSEKLPPVPGEDSFDEFLSAHLPEETSSEISRLVTPWTEHAFLEPECCVAYPLENGGRRNGKRIIYSNDGLIFYTEDHYNTFEEITFQ